MTETNKEIPGRRVLQETNHPEFGRCVPFVDKNGLGMQIGEGDASFIARPATKGFISVEAPTETAKEAAKRLYGNILAHRGGHN